MTSPLPFAELYADVAGAARAWARLKARGPLGGMLDADDLLQEVSYQAYRSFDGFDPERGGFRAWFFGVANLVAQSLLRKSARAHANAGAFELLESRAGAIPADVTTVSRRVARDEALDKLGARFAALEEEERTLLCYRGLEGLPHDQVGALMGIGADAANKRWQRLRDKLRDAPEVRGLFAEE